MTKKHFPCTFRFLIRLSLSIGFLVNLAQAQTGPLKTSAAPSLVKEKELEAQRKYGSYLFKIANCKDCHTEKNGGLLAGGFNIESPFGVFYGPNITVDKETGIGNWTDEDFIRALRRGVAPTGRNYFPSFPYSSYSKLSDSDILALKVYIFSLPAIKKDSKPHEIKFPFNVREFINVWKWNNFTSFSTYTEENLKKARGPYQFISTRDWDWNRGAYLVEGALHCAQCHSPRDNLGNFKWDLWMSGAPLFGAKKGATNITQSKKHGVGNWTASDWETFLTEGESPNGTAAVGKMGKIIEDSTSRLSRADLRAVIKYLMSIKAVESSEVSKKE